MDEKILMAFECPHCLGLIRDVSVPIDDCNCPHCTIQMYVILSQGYPALHIVGVATSYFFRKSFGYAGINIVSNSFPPLIGYYLEGHEKDFFKLKAERDLILKESLTKPNLELAKQGTYKSPNDLSQIIKEVTDYIESTNSDKYGKSPLPEMLGPDGKAINTFQIKKYLTRYMSKGFEKSELRSDLLKIIHYAMFELERTKSKC